MKSRQTNKFMGQRGIGGGVLHGLFLTNTQAEWKHSFNLTSHPTHILWDDDDGGVRENWGWGGIRRCFFPMMLRQHRVVRALLLLGFSKSWFPLSSVREFSRGIWKCHDATVSPYCGRKPEVQEDDRNAATKHLRRFGGWPNSDNKISLSDQNQAEQNVWKYWVLPIQNLLYFFNSVFTKVKF